MKRHFSVSTILLFLISCSSAIAQLTDTAAEDNPPPKVTEVISTDSSYLLWIGVGILLLVVVVFIIIRRRDRSKYRNK